jgi:hypothetical protein
MTTVLLGAVVCLFIEEGGSYFGEDVTLRLGRTVGVNLKGERGSQDGAHDLGRSYGAARLDLLVQEGLKNLD